MGSASGLATLYTKKVGIPLVPLVVRKNVTLLGRASWYVDDDNF